MNQSETNHDLAAKLTAKSTNEKIFYVRVGLHTEFQKLGKRPEEREKILDKMDSKVKEDMENANIEFIGIKNTKAQNKAIFAIQKLLENTDYKGNSVGMKIPKGNPFKMDEVILPVLRITQAQYLEAYGVKKYKTSRDKKEFSGRETQRALKALEDLSTKRYLFYYERKNLNKNKKDKNEKNKKNEKNNNDIICTVQPLIRIKEGYEGFTQQERDKVKSGDNARKNDIKPKYLDFVPCPILIDQFDPYGVLKPVNYYQEIERVSPRASKFVYSFIDYLMIQIYFMDCESTTWTTEINYLKLAYKLRMDKYIESRQRKRIKEVLKKCYEIAKKLNYLLSYKTVPGVRDEKEVLELNPKKFAKQQSADRRRNKKSK